MWQRSKPQIEETIAQTNVPMNVNRAKYNGSRGAPSKAAAQQVNKPRQEKKTRKPATTEGMTTPSSADKGS
jgi:hypothetical protein